MALYYNTMSAATRRASLALGALLLAPRRPFAQARPRVVASFSILGDLVRQLAGEAVALHVLAGPETEAHGFQPRPSDAEAVRMADLILRNGLGFEPWLDRLVGSTASAARVVTASAGILAAPGVPPGDPHAWLDARHAAAYVRTIAAALPGLPLATAPLLGRLAALDADILAGIAQVPEARRVLVTGHAAFGHFAARYGVRALSPQAAGDHAEGSAATLAALVRQVRAGRLTALFRDGPGPAPVLARLAREAGAPVAGRLYADTLSPPEGPAATYEAMMRHNLSLMVPAMLGA